MKMKIWKDETIEISIFELLYYKPFKISNPLKSIIP